MGFAMVGPTFASSARPPPPLPHACANSLRPLTHPSAPPLVNALTPPHSLRSAVDSFDFADDLSNKVAGSFATGGSAAAGLQPVLEQLNRGLMTFQMLIAGGASWMSTEGTGIVVANGTIPNGDAGLVLGRAQGARIAGLAAKLKGGSAPPPPAPPPPAPTPPAPTPPPSPLGGQPPGWGDQWTAKVSANLTQVGYGESISLLTHGHTVQPYGAALRDII